MRRAPSSADERAAERFASEPVDKSSTTSTRAPSESKRSTMCEPRKPAPPTTMTAPGCLATLRWVIPAL